MADAFNPLLFLLCALAEFVDFVEHIGIDADDDFRRDTRVAPDDGDLYAFPGIDLTADDGALCREQLPITVDAAVHHTLGDLHITGRFDNCRLFT